MSGLLATKPYPIAIYLASDATKTPVLKADRTAGAVYVLSDEPKLGDLSYGGIQERFISNPNAAGSIWVTFFDGQVPAANAEGCFEIGPGASWSGAVTAQIRAVFTAAAMAILNGAR